TGLDAARQSVALAKELYVTGLGDFLAVLDAQRQQFQMERELAASRSSVLLGTVRLYKAMGE
ncbi:MAG: TolC family protein, partial [Bryobacteraceae bacterium]